MLSAKTRPLPDRGGPANPWLIGVVMCCVTACGTDADSTDAEIYAHVLSVAQAELGLPSSLAIHPLLALWPEVGRLDSPLTGLNAYDTTSVAEIIAANPGAYRLCELSNAGTCRISPTDVSIVLSSLRRLETGDLALRLVVFDGRSASGFYNEYLVRLNHGWLDGWAVVAFARLN